MATKRGDENLRELDTPALQLAAARSEERFDRGPFWSRDPTDGKYGALARRKATDRPDPDTSWREREQEV